MLQEGSHAPEVAFIVRRVGAPNWLNENPMPTRVTRPPVQVLERQFNNFGTSMIRRRPRQLSG